MAALVFVDGWVFFLRLILCQSKSLSYYTFLYAIDKPYLFVIWAKNTNSIHSIDHIETDVI